MCLKEVAAATTMIVFTNKIKKGKRKRKKCNQWVKPGFEHFPF